MTILIAVENSLFWTDQLFKIFRQSVQQSDNTIVENGEHTNLHKASNFPTSEDRSFPNVLCTPVHQHNLHLATTQILHKSFTPVIRITMRSRANSAMAVQNPAAV